MGQPMMNFSLPDFLACGARRIHGIVSGNVFAALKQQLRGSRCRAFHETMKVQIEDHTIVYPDVFVTCDADDLVTDRVFKAPTVVVEVLSPSTEGSDRGVKFALYRSLPSLREYLLVDPDTREVSLFRRGAVDGLFVLHDRNGRDELRLDSLGCTLRADEVFEGVETPPGWQPAMPG